MRRGGHNRLAFALHRSWETFWPAGGLRGQPGAAKHQPLFRQGVTRGDCQHFRQWRKTGLSRQVGCSLKAPISTTASRSLFPTHVACGRMDARNLGSSLPAVPPWLTCGGDGRGVPFLWAVARERWALLLRAFQRLSNIDWAARNLRSSSVSNAKLLMAASARVMMLTARERLS